MKQKPNLVCDFFGIGLVVFFRYGKVQDIFLSLREGLVFFSSFLLKKRLT